MSTYRLKEAIENTGTPEQIKRFREKHPELYESDAIKMTPETAAYWDKVRSGESVKEFEIHDVIRLIHRFSEHYVGAGAATYDPNANAEHVKLIAQYLTKSPEFLSNPLVRNVASFHKSLMLLGSVGSGKSCLMYAASRVRNVANPVLGRLVNESEITLEEKLINQYMRHNLIIDDLGKNKNGLEVRWMRQLLEVRYTLFKTVRKKTHITTNLIMSGPNSVEVIYGDHVYDRMKEMCNIVVLSREKSLRV